VIVQPIVLVSSSISASVSPELISQLDGRVRLDLQHHSDSFFFWVAFSAIVVAFGCLLEGPEILHEIFPKLFSFFTWSSKDRRDKFERQIKKIALVGWLLVVLGIGVEGVFEVYEYQASELLQTFNEILLTEAQENAGNAADAAERARAAADGADAIAKEAKATAGDAKTDAGKVESIASVAESRAVEAKLNAEAAERSATEAQVKADAVKGALDRDMDVVRKNVDILAGWRPVTASLDLIEVHRDPAKLKILLEMQEYSGIRIFVGTTPSDTEEVAEDRKRLAAQVISLLKGARWAPTLAPAWIPGGTGPSSPSGYPIGIWILRNDDLPTSRTALASDALYRLLKLEVGSGVGEMVDSPNPAFAKFRSMFGFSVQPDALMIWIGATPPAGVGAFWPPDFPASPPTKQNDSNPTTNR
jgi:hypothetical protein